MRYIWNGYTASFTLQTTTPVPSKHQVWPETLKNSCSQPLSDTIQRQPSCQFYFWFTVVLFLYLHLSCFWDEQPSNQQYHKAHRLQYYWIREIYDTQFLSNQNISVVLSMYCNCKKIIFSSPSIIHKLYFYLACDQHRNWHNLYIVDFLECCEYVFKCSTLVPKYDLNFVSVWTTNTSV